jgi:eukaryotic-like serine/threonine-protein kinase
MIQVGSIIGSYRVVTRLGQGGMGAVFVAEHTLLGRRAAIKVLPAPQADDAAVVRRFFREAQIASAVADPGIVQVFDFGYHTDGSAYILMELLDGEPLDARLRRLGRLPPVAALRIARQIATSLAAAHARGIVHRDLKPENVVLVPDAAVAGGERAKILDFGIATVVSRGRAGAPGPVMGTPLTMSPEQCRGSAELDHRSDIYSLGCVLFQLLVGRPPFEGDTAADVIARHLVEPPPVPSTLVPELPPDLDALVLCCLAKSPDARFQRMTELIAGIGMALPARPRGPRGPRPPTPVRRPAPITLVSRPVGSPALTEDVRAPDGRRRGWLALLVAVATLLASASATAVGIVHSGVAATAAPSPPAARAASRCTGVDSAPPRRRAARMPARQSRSHRSAAVGGRD